MKKSAILCVLRVERSCRTGWDLRLSEHVSGFQAPPTPEQDTET